MKRFCWDILTWTTIVAILLNMLKKGNALMCFRCNSVDQSDTECEDTFQTHTLGHLLDRDCRVGVLDYHGFYCVKIKGEKKATGEQIVIRTCSVDNWGSQCGDIFFQTPIDGSEEVEQEAINGCVESCNFDGCNRSGSISSNLFVLCGMTFIIGLILKLRS